MSLESEQERHALGLELAAELQWLRGMVALHPDLQRSNAALRSEVRYKREQRQQARHERDEARAEIERLKTRFRGLNELENIIRANWNVLPPFIHQAVRDIDRRRIGEHW